MTDFESRIQLPTEELGWCVIYDDHTREFEYEKDFERKWADVLPHEARIIEVWWVDKHRNPVLGLLVKEGIFVVMNMFFRTEFPNVPKKIYINKERTDEQIPGQPPNQFEEYELGFEASYKDKTYRQVLEVLHDHTFKIMNSW